MAPEPTVQKNFDLPIELAERLERAVHMGMAVSQRQLTIDALTTAINHLEDTYRKGTN